MDWLIIVGIIIFVVNMINKAKTVSQKRPGGEPPKQPTVYRQPSSQPTPRPANAPADGKSVWGQLSELLESMTEDGPPPATAKRAAAPQAEEEGIPMEGAYAARQSGSLPGTITGSALATPPGSSEGASSEGSPGGLADYSPIQPKTTDGGHAAAKVSAGPLSSLMADDMRRAVILSEILTRPSQRTRKWARM